MDVGTGDGRYPLHLARAEGGTFAVGLEPSLDALRRTARAIARQRVPNLALVVAAVEAAPLGPIADVVTVHFPWGPLLDAALGRDAAVLGAVAALAKPGARLRVLASVIERDAVPGSPDSDVIAAAYAAAGLDRVAVRPATPADVVAARSSWGKRLGAGRARPAFVLEAIRR